MQLVYIYPLDKKKIWTGDVVIQDAKLPLTGVANDAPPELTGDEVAKRMGSQWVILPEYPPEPVIDNTPIKYVPATITRRQCKQQLVIMDLLASVQPLIDSIEDATQKALMQIYWEDSLEFERNHPSFIQMGAGLGLSEEEIDDAFIAASLL
jgi:hypothetical protein